MQRGHVALPKRVGTTYPSTDLAGVEPNKLTSAGDRDPLLGTPWHKFVPARLERLG